MITILVKVVINLAIVFLNMVKKNAIQECLEPDIAVVHAIKIGLVIPVMNVILIIMEEIVLI